MALRNDASHQSGRCRPVRIADHALTLHKQQQQRQRQATDFATMGFFYTLSGCCADSTGSGSANIIPHARWLNAFIKRFADSDAATARLAAGGGALSSDRLLTSGPVNGDGDSCTEASKLEFTIHKWISVIDGSLSRKKSVCTTGRTFAPRGKKVQRQRCEVQEE